MDNRSVSGSRDLGALTGGGGCWQRSLLNRWGGVGWGRVGAARVGVWGVVGRGSKFEKLYTFCQNIRR